MQNITIKNTNYILPTVEDFLIYYVDDERYYSNAHVLKKKSFAFPQLVILGNEIEICGEKYQSYINILDYHSLLEVPTVEYFKASDVESISLNPLDTTSILSRFYESEEEEQSQNL